MAARVFDPVPRFIGELAEVHFPGMRRLAEHVDIRAGTEHPVPRARDHDGADFWMLEPDPLQEVVQLDVDAEIVRIELELVALEQGALLVHIHQQGRDLTVDGEFPMPVLRRIGLEVDAALAAVQFAFCLSHGCPRNVTQEAEVRRLRCRRFVAAEI